MHLIQNEQWIWVTVNTANKCNYTIYEPSKQKQKIYVYICTIHAPTRWKSNLSQFWHQLLLKLLQLVEEVFVRVYNRAYIFNISNCAFGITLELLHYVSDDKRCASRDCCLAVYEHNTSLINEIKGITEVVYNTFFKAVAEAKSLVYEFFWVKGLYV